jgi:hypothetical protein
MQGRPPLQVHGWTHAASGGRDRLSRANALTSGASGSVWKGEVYLGTLDGRLIDPPQQVLNPPPQFGTPELITRGADTYNRFCSTAP